MQSSTLVSSFAEIAREKGIDRDSLQLIVEDVFRAMIRKRYGADDSFEIIFNPDHGDIQIIHVREVIPNLDMEDPVTQIELNAAKSFDEDFGIGDEVASEVNITDFGRRAVMTARQTFSQRIRDIEKENVFQEYSELIGEVVVGEIYQVRRREVLVIHNKVELVLPRNEQIYKDRYRKGDMLRAVVKEVRRDAGANPQVIISRADPVFMERLFELEVPEIYDGIVEIKKIVREPGERAKVAVVSHDERIDPVGACVGVKGVRIHAVVRELGNENIDVLEWADDPFKLISRALSPANPVSVTVNDELDPPRAKVVVKADEVSQAIGRGGINIRLASRLTGYEIDVYREIAADEEDIEIDEFADAFTADTLEKLHNIGCDTAKQVLELSLDELVRRSGLEHETAQHVLDTIKMEFEDEEEEELEG
ncbi:MAG: transcription termination factor NusA [Rhodothermales bacterium]